MGFSCVHQMIAVAAVGSLAAGTAHGAFAVFSTLADNSVRTLNDTSGVFTQGTLITGQSLSNATRTDGHLLFSTVGQAGTHIIDPNISGTPAYTNYSSILTLGYAASSLDGRAVGNLVDSSNVTRFYRFDATGPVQVNGVGAAVAAVSDGVALVSFANNQRRVYDIDSNTLGGNLGAGVSVLAAAGDSGQFIADFFGNSTRLVNDAFAPTTTLSGTKATAVFGSRDILFYSIGVASGAWDTRSNAAASPAFANTSGALFVLAAGNSNRVYYSHGSNTSFYDPDDTDGDGIKAGGFSSQQLVSGFAFGDYAVLGLRNTDGLGGRAIVVNDKGQFITTLATSTGNDLAAYVTGAGVVSVPEPAALSLLTAGGFLLLRRRR